MWWERAWSPRVAEAHAGHESVGSLWGRRMARIMPPLLIVGGIIFDLSTPAGYTASPFFSAAPLGAAAMMRLRGTVWTAIASVCAAGLLTVLHGIMNRTQEEAEIATVGTVALLAIGMNRVVRRGDRRLASVRGIAEAAQRAVLPTPPARIAGLDVAARYVAAQVGAAIGGDMYAVQDTPYGVRVLVGDVRGKGLGAVEAVAIVIGAFREAAEQEATLEGLVDRLERALQREGARRANVDQYEGFTTALVAEISRSGSTLRLINRGHPAPLLLQPDGGVRLAEPEVPALPLGMGELGVWPDRVEELRFRPGAILLLFTDGLTEARNRAGDFYDPVERLAGRVFDQPETLLDGLVEDVAWFTGGGPTDDMALLAVSRSPVPPETTTVRSGG